MADQQTVVAGGGALGLSLALVLAQAGHQVSLCEAGQFGDNASGVAAGMIAPAMETVLDPASAGHFELLLAARAAWPDFAARSGLPIEGDGAALVGAEGFVQPLQAQLLSLGVPLQQIDAATLSKIAPGAEAGVFTPIDWRIDPVLALAALKAAAERAGVRVFGQAVTGFEPGRVALAGGKSLAAERLVIAAGYAPGLASLAPELSNLAPIKGQIIHVPRAAPPPCVVRGEGVYVCPASRGVVIGATMEAGRSDRNPDWSLIQPLLDKAGALNPDFIRGPGHERVGVRAETPDGLPMVGPSRAEGVWVLTGARRNGWLLAPLLAQSLAAQIRGEKAPFGQVLDPRRFSLT